MCDYYGWTLEAENKKTKKNKNSYTDFCLIYFQRNKLAIICV